MEFKDLEFKARDFGGVGAQYTFDNGITISVQASQVNYSTPRENLGSPNDFSSFEVGMWDANGWVTKELVDDAGDDVLGWQSREDINNLIKKVNNH
jgi:hypothetical protein